MPPKAPPVSAWPKAAANGAADARCSSHFLLCRGPELQVWWYQGVHSIPKHCSVRIPRRNTVKGNWRSKEAKRKQCRVSISFWTQYISEKNLTSAFQYLLSQWLIISICNREPNGVTGSKMPGKCGCLVTSTSVP